MHVSEFYKLCDFAEVELGNLKLIVQTVCVCVCVCAISTYFIAPEKWWVVVMGVLLACVAKEVLEAFVVWRCYCTVATCSHGNSERE